MLVTLRFEIDVIEIAAILTCDLGICVLQRCKVR